MNDSVEDLIYDLKRQYFSERLHDARNGKLDFTQILLIKISEQLDNITDGLQSIRDKMDSGVSVTDRHF